MDHLKAITVLAAWITHLDVHVLALMMFEPHCAVSKDCWKQVRNVGRYALSVDCEIGDLILDRAVCQAASTCNTYYYG